MKLKNKLFFYFFILFLFVLIVFSVLVYQLIELNNVTRLQVQQDVREVTDLLLQQNLIEELYDRYIIFNLPVSDKNDYKQRIYRSINHVEENWQQYMIRRKQFDHDPFLFLLSDLNNDRNETIYSGQKRNYEQNYRQDWAVVKKLIFRGVEKGFGQDEKREITTKVNMLRSYLTELSQVISQTGIQKAAYLKEITRQIYYLTFIFFAITIALLILISFILARRLTKPIEKLKESIHDMAQQNYDVYIENKSNDEIGELSADFEQLATRLKENQKYKDLMLSQFTHEMKSPLGAIKQATHLLHNSTDATVQKDAARLLSIINGNNETLFALINNILKSTRFEGEELQLNFVKTDVVKHFSQSFVLLAPIIKSKNIKVDFEFSSQKIEAEIDQDKMKEVFQNIIANAVKFSPEGSVIQASLKQKFPQIIYAIKDEGIGIPHKEIPYIFEKMYRASNSRKISVKGTGLGLFIASRIVKAHGGVIRVFSEPDKGSEFVVEIPLNRQIARERVG